MLAKKSLGQNFLKSKQALQSMTKASSLIEKDIVIEIGPGKGALTEALLSTGATVFAIEKDDRLMEVLEQKFSEAIQNKKLFLIHGDILNTETREKIIDEAMIMGGGIYKVVANIPYYITGEIIRELLTTKNKPSLMTLLVQKEVAERIVARSRGKEIGDSLLSLSVKAYGTPKYIETVHAKYFSPAPKVDSAIISISDISNSFFEDISEEKFFELLHKGFAHKRKVLIGNLREAGYDSKKLSKVFEKLTIDLKIRAQEIKILVWKKLAIEL